MNTVKIRSKQTKIIAHRGLSGIERENTNAAFLAAGNRSYFGIETDVHTTRDGKFIIIHDETTDRVTLDGYKINVEENDYASVEGIVLPDRDGSTTRGDIRIPLLSEYIAICKKYEKICVLEVKNHFAEDDLKRMLDEIEKLGYLENVIFISFDFLNCVNLRRYLPQNEIQWLTCEDITNKMADTLCENKLDLDIHYKKLTEVGLKMLHMRGIKVNCWTCDDKGDAERLVEMGVDFITTNILEGSAF